MLVWYRPQEKENMKCKNDHLHLNKVVITISFTISGLIRTNMSLHFSGLRMIYSSNLVIGFV